MVAGALRGRPGLRAGVLLPQRAELRESGLLPGPCQGRAAGRDPGGVPRPSSTPSGCRRPLLLLAEPVAEQALLAEALTVRAGRKVELARAAARRAAPAGRDRADQCPPGAGAPARRHGEPGGAARAAGRTVRAAGRAGPDRGLRQQPHPGQQRDRRLHRRRPRGLRQDAATAPSTSRAATSPRATTTP